MAFLIIITVPPPPPSIQLPYIVLLQSNCDSDSSQIGGYSRPCGTIPVPGLGRLASASFVDQGFDFSVAAIQCQQSIDIDKAGNHQ